MALHRPPAGESMIKHTASADCPCKPRRIVVTKQRTTGKFGRHQGYNSSEVFEHNPMPKEA